MTRALVVLSGGQDSTTCLYWAKEAGYEIHAVTFNYGQRHAAELKAAEKIAEMAGVKSWELIDLGDDILKSTSPLVSDTELEQYADAASLPSDGIEKTFVPMRNQLFLTIAANRAVALGCKLLVTGVCQEDYGGYPDCREYFVNSLENTINCGLMEEYNPTDPALAIATPLMWLTKKATVEMALNLPGCYEALAFSHTAYDGQYPPVGKDHATLLRAKGFAEAGVPDPLLLRAAFFDSVMSLTELPDGPEYYPANMRPWIERLVPVCENK